MAAKKPTKPEPGPTLEVADEICRRLGEGETLRNICRDEHMPARRTVYDWIDQFPEFAKQLEVARQIGADAIAEDCLRIADTTEFGKVTTKKGKSTEVKSGDMLEHRKLKIWTRLQLLAKWHPKKYGDKQQVEHSGELTLNGLAERMRKQAAE